MHRDQKACNNECVFAEKAVNDPSVKSFFK